MKAMKEYTICEALNAKYLMHLVKERIDEGWKPSGGVEIALAIDFENLGESWISTPTEIEHLPGFVVYVQAMVK